MAAGTLFIITAPSGAGKTSLVKALIQADPQIKCSVSFTTRAPRPGEVEGQDYHFVNEAAFLEKLQRGDFLEHAIVYGNRYGTSKSWIEQAMREGFDIVLEIDWQGARQVRKIFPEAVSIFILPPSIDALLARLTERKQDHENVIQQRIAAAKGDISHLEESEYAIINNDFNIALSDLNSVVRAQRLKMGVQLERYADLINQLKK